MKVHFLSFGAPFDKYEHTVKRINDEAVKFGEFNSINIHTDKDIYEVCPHLLKNKEFIEGNKRGYGFWIWKSALIKHYLYNVIDEGDILWYLDAGCQVNTSERSKTHYKRYLKHFQKHDCLRFEMHYVEKRWCKLDTFRLFFPVDDYYLDTGQLYGGIIGIKNTSNMRKIFSEALKINLMDNHHHITNDKSRIPNNPVFGEHRHDQSILSLIFKKYGYFESGACIRDESWVVDERNEHSPFRATRNRVRYQDC